MSTAPSSISIQVTQIETMSLLDLIGHDGDTFDDLDIHKIVKSLYRTYAAFSPGVNAIDIELTDRQLYLVHRYFTPTSFGAGGKEFRNKIARAFVELERLQDMPELSLSDGESPYDARYAVERMKDMEKDNG